MPGITDLLTKTARQVRNGRESLAKRAILPRSSFLPITKIARPSGMTGKKMFRLTTALAVTGGSLWIIAKAMNAKRREEILNEGLSQLQPFATPPRPENFATVAEELVYINACREIPNKREAVLWVLTVCHRISLPESLPEKTAGQAREWVVNQIHDLSQTVQQKKCSFDDLSQYQQHNFIACAKVLFPELDKYKPNEAFYQMALKKLDEQLQTANDHYKKENSKLELIENSGVTHAK